MGDFDWERRPEIQWSYRMVEDKGGGDFKSLGFINAGPVFLRELAKDMMKVIDGAQLRLDQTADNSGRRYSATKVKNRLVAWLAVSYNMAFEKLPSVSTGSPFNETIKACFTVLGFESVDDSRRRINYSIEKMEKHHQCRGNLACTLDEDKENCPYPQFVSTRLDLEAHDQAE
jgi:hypothetical protein